MADPKLKPKTRSASNTEDYITFLKSDEFSIIIDAIVKKHTDELMIKIESLGNEVKVLRESNIDLIRLLRNEKCSKVNNHNEIVREKQNIPPDTDSIKSGDSVIESIAVPKTYAYTCTASQKKEISQDEQLFIETDKMLQKAPSHPPTRNFFTNNFVKKNKSENTIIIGTNNNKDDSKFDTFEATARRLWIYVGRCKQDTTEEKIKSYLQGKSPGRSFDVVKLNTKGTNTAFRIAADMDLQDSLYDASFWPSGILVKRYMFFRNRETHQSDREF